VSGACAKVGEVCNLAWEDGRRRRDGAERKPFAIPDASSSPLAALAREVANLAYFVALAVSRSVNFWKLG